MLCPKCHNDNPITNETCDFCMAILPMTEERKNAIKKIKKVESQKTYKNSIDKIVGSILGIIVIVVIILIATFLIKR